MIPSPRLLTLVLATAACGLPGLAQTDTPPEAAPTGLVEIFKDVRKKYYIESLKGDEAACAKLLEGYQRAEAAPDAKPQQVHDMLAFKIEAIKLRGKALRNADRLNDALDVLTVGWIETQAHFSSTHFHIAIQAQGLFRELAITLLRLGRTNNADGVIGFARDTLDTFWDAREKHTSEVAKDLLGSGLVDGEMLEDDIGKIYADAYFERSSRTTISMAKADLRARVIESRSRAVKWLLAKDKMGVKNALDENPNVRFAEYKLDLGWALYDDGRKNEAAEEFLAAHSAVHDLKERSQGIEGAGAFSTKEVKELTQRAAEGWSLASGQFDKAFDAAFDQWYQKELKDLETTGEETNPFIKR